MLHADEPDLDALSNQSLFPDTLWTNRVESAEEVSAFLDAKNAETRKKINHLEKVSRLLNIAAETLRDFNTESDQRLAEFVRELYKDIRENELEISKEGCDQHQG